MKGLKHLFVFKMAATALLWCFPLLTLSAGQFASMGFPAPQPMMFARLLGAAYLALAFGYWSGVKELNAGRMPHAAIANGIAGNGFTLLVLSYFGLTGGWSDWGAYAQAFMWLSTVGALAMVLSLMALGRRKA